MREQRAVRRGRGRRSFTWAFGLLTALGVAAPAWAQTPVPRFGMTSLAQRQVAALHLVLVEPPDAGHPGCRVTASFVNANGQVFNTRAGKPVRRTVTLKPQIAASFELRSEEILASTRTHMLIRAVLTPATSAGATSDCGCLIATAQIRNEDGVTVLSDSGKDPIYRGNPPPPPPGACTASLF